MYGRIIRPQVDDLVTEEEHYFHEGSSMGKIGDTYYLVYSNIERGKPTSLGYATSKSPRDYSNTAALS